MVHCCIAVFYCPVVLKSYCGGFVKGGAQPPSLSSGSGKQISWRICFCETSLSLYHVDGLIQKINGPNITFHDK